MNRAQSDRHDYCVDL